MKATDLMIGDWVVVHARVDKIAKIEAIDLQGVKTSIGGPWMFDEIEPIPLTPEILKKNGWQYFSGSPCSVYQLKAQGSYYISLYSCIEGRFEIQISGLWFEIQFVHDLQHALRLCGIEKEVVV